MSLFKAGNQYTYAGHNRTGRYGEIVWAYFKIAVPLFATIGLFFHAIPYLWTWFEGGNVRRFTHELRDQILPDPHYENTKSENKPENKRLSKIDNITDLLLDVEGRPLFATYLFVNFLCLGVIVTSLLGFSMIMKIQLFDYENLLKYLSYQTLDQHQRSANPNDELIWLFPRTFLYNLKTQYGPSGTREWK